MRRIAIVLVLALGGASARAATPVPVAGGDLVLTGATVHVGDGRTVLENATVVVKGGRIASVGRDAAPAGATVLDLRGQHLAPGFLAPDTFLGLNEIGAVRATRDETEVGTLNPHVRASVAVNPDSELLPVAMANGVLAAVVAPRGGLVSGTSAVMLLTGWTREDMTLRDPAALHVSWPSHAVNRASDAKPPADEQVAKRSAELDSLDELLARARAYLGSSSDRAAGRLPRADRRPELEALAPALSGAIPVVVSADSVPQIRAAIAWARRQGLRLVVAGGRDAWRIAEEIAEAKVPVIVSPVRALPQRDDEAYDVNNEGPVRLARAGVTIAFNVDGAAHVRNLPEEAAASIPWGLSAEEALRAITSAPAEMFGVAEDVGLVAAGRWGNLVAWDGPPLETTSRVTRLVVRGHEVPLDDRHTRLWRKYDARPALGR